MLTNGPLLHSRIWSIFTTPLQQRTSSRQFGQSERRW